MAPTVTVHEYAATRRVGLRLAFLAAAGLFVLWSLAGEAQGATADQLPVADEPAAGESLEQPAQAAAKPSDVKPQVATKQGEDKAAQTPESVTEPAEPTVKHASPDTTQPATETSRPTSHPAESAVKPATDTTKPATHQAEPAVKPATHQAEAAVKPAEETADDIPPGDDALQALVDETTEGGRLATEQLEKVVGEAIDAVEPVVDRTDPAGLSLEDVLRITEPPPERVSRALDDLEQTLLRDVAATGFLQGFAAGERLRPAAFLVAGRTVAAPADGASWLADPASLPAFLGDGTEGMLQQSRSAASPAPGHGGPRMPTIPAAAALSSVNSRDGGSSQLAAVIRNAGILADPSRGQGASRATARFLSRTITPEDPPG